MLMADTLSTYGITTSKVGRCLYQFSVLLVISKVTIDAFVVYIDIVCKVAWQLGVDEAIMHVLRKLHLCVTTTFMFHCVNIVNVHLEFECANCEFGEGSSACASLLYATVCDSCCNIGVVGCRHCTQSLQFVAERECCCPSRSFSNLCSTIFISRHCY